MTKLVMRTVVRAVMVYLLALPWTASTWRTDVTTSPGAVERGIGQSASIVCDVRNMSKRTQHLVWVFLDADTVQDQLVSSETTVQETYRDRFSVSRSTFGVRVRRERYGLSISNLRKEDDGTYRCQVMNSLTRTVVQYSVVSVSVLYFPDPPVCVPSGEFFVMAHSQVTMSCTSASGNPTVNMEITRKVKGIDTLPVVPLPTAIGRRSANWTYYENDDTILRELTVEVSLSYNDNSFPCTISAPNPLRGIRRSSCIMGPIRVIPVAPRSTISVTVEPRVLTVAVGQPAEFTCRVGIYPPVDRARVQKSWSTFPVIDTGRLVKRNLNYAETVWIRAVEMDDDGLVVTCQTVIRGARRTASSRLQVVLPTRPLLPVAPRATTARPRPTTAVKTFTRTIQTTVNLPTANHVTKYVKKTPNHFIPAINRLPNVTTISSSVSSDFTPTLPAVLIKPWYSKPTGIALIVITVLFVLVIVIGIVCIKRLSRKQLSRKVSLKNHDVRYQNVYTTADAAMRREASRRQQVTVMSTHIYHEARILPEKLRVDSTVDGLSNEPLVVYAETVVNSLYEAEDDRSKTMPCRKSGTPKNGRQRYCNVIGGLGDSSRHVTLPNNFMIYGDFNLENANPYESLIGI